MLEKIRERLLAFIASDRDVPLLAGFSVGFYMMLFYYSKNFALANSLQQVLFFTAYYIIMPIAVLFVGYKLFSLTKFSTYKKHFLFIGMLGLLTFFLLQIGNLGSLKKIIFASVLFVSLLLSYWISRYYKLITVLLLLISLFNITAILESVYTITASSDQWKKQPDAIESIVFKQKPNIYYIQPDGYTSFKNLRENPLYDFDNSNYESFLKQNGFTLYNDYRSNYPSTLLSNSATFSMKHHYIQKDVEDYAARSIIVGENPVLKIVKNNGYKTLFITENPYLLINRPALGYDFSNIDYNEIPYLKDGFGITKDVEEDLKKKIKENGNSGNFYFVEKFTPGHITVYSRGTTIEEEKEMYIKEIQKANAWLKNIVSYIDKADPDAIIIIGADHGGFTGFEHTLEAYKKTTDKNLIYSIFGAHLAIKWNSEKSGEYDKQLKTGINLFRIVFSFLAKEKKYLNSLQENSSYMILKEPKGIYRYINENGNVVFEKK